MRSIGSIYPPLEVLSLRGYYFTGSGVAAWMRAMDWSRLHTLELGEEVESLPFIQAMAAVKILALASFKLVIPYLEDDGEQVYMDAFRIFLLGTSEHGLESLALQGSGFRRIFREVVRHYVYPRCDFGSALLHF
jgi:hypothetical protein